MTAAVSGGHGAPAAAAPLPLSVLPLRAAGYAVHALHREDQAWVQKNCYADVWIETVHALGLEPLAMLAFTLPLSFEGDQWTFYKPPHRDLTELYGIEVEELNVWRGNLLEHARHHIAEGKMVFTEADAFWMPDAAGTDYREQHTKSTIVINAIDVAGRRLGYFHNAGYFELEGEDFTHLFRLGYEHDPAYMPFFAEFVRIDRRRALPLPELVAASLRLLRFHLARRPAANPIERFAERFPQDVAWLQQEGLHFYHRYAFATLRQLGSNFELAASYMAWLGASGEAGLAPAEGAFRDISSGAKALLLKTARAVNSGRPAQVQELLQDMAGAWRTGMDCLQRRYG